MPSNRFTKINIDIETYAMLQVIAAAKGTSATALLEQIILFYLKHEQKTGKKEI